MCFFFFLIIHQAYAWGFDIRNWHKHLNQLTWPEIFRQLALSAGYGPQLKKRSITWSCANDKDEVQFSLFCFIVFQLKLLRFLCYVRTSIFLLFLWEM